MIWKPSSTIAVLLVFAISIRKVQCQKSHYIHWNIRNFEPYLKNTALSVVTDDHIVISCPRMRVPTNYQHVKIYMVTQAEYKHCILYKPQWVGTCNSNAGDMTIKFTVVEGSPLFEGFEFAPGGEYYLISTSSGFPDGIDDKYGGLCYHYGMKVKFRVYANKRREKKIENPRRNVLKFDDHVVLYQIHDYHEFIDDSSDGTLDFSLFETMLVVMLVMW